MSAVEIPNAVFVSADKLGGSIMFIATVPEVHARALEKILRICIERKTRCIDLRIGLPHKPRSVGPRSINNRIHGHCEDIAIQLAGGEKGREYDAEEIYAAMKRMAVADGYPTYLSIDGIETPLPMRYSSQEQAMIVSKVIQRYADTHGFWLSEYDKTVFPPEVYQSLGGRTKKEMDALNENT